MNKVGSIPILYKLKALKLRKQYAVKKSPHLQASKLKRSKKNELGLVEGVVGPGCPYKTINFFLKSFYKEKNDEIKKINLGNEKVNQ